jgi:hypothetical protein
MKCMLLYANLLFCLLENIIYFAHVSSFYFNQERFQNSFLYKNYFYNI